MIINSLFEDSCRFYKVISIKEHKTVVNEGRVLAGRGVLPTTQWAHPRGLCSPAAQVRPWKGRQSFLLGGSFPKPAYYQTGRTSGEGIGMK